MPSAARRDARRSGYRLPTRDAIVMENAEGAMRHTGIFAAALVGALGLPFLLSEKEAVPDAGGAAIETVLVTPEGTTSAMASPWIAPLPERIEGPGAEQFSDVFRFDVTVGWITSRWARVSTAPRDGGLQGYRVALVSGTQLDDAAGALTYYFNAQHECVRVDFRGSTGDVRRLVATLEAMYGFRLTPTSDHGVHLYRAEYRDQLEGELRITTADVVTTARPRERYRVQLTLEKPVREARFNTAWR